jgi:hypothetical protein
VRACGPAAPRALFCVISIRCCGVRWWRERRGAPLAAGGGGDLDCVLVSSACVAAAPVRTAGLVHTQ